MAYGFFSNAIVSIKFDWHINIKQCIGYTFVIFLVYGFVSFRSIFLLSIRWLYQLLFRLMKWSHKKENHQEISNNLKERHLDMWGLSVMNVRRFCNENRIRTRKTLDNSEIEKEVTKSIPEVISEFFQNVRNKMLFYS